MQNFLDAIGSVVWGVPMLIFFLFTAIRFTVKSRFFQIRGIKTVCRSTLGSIFKKSDTDGISQFGAFCSVLGACIGTGNIVGVATAVYSGGQGTVFWMWLSAIFSMMTAYSENHLGIKYKKKDKYGQYSGGAFSYIENGVGMKKLAKIYAVFCLMSSLGMGNIAQSNSTASALKEGFEVNIFVSGIIIAILCFVIINGGIKRLSNFGIFIVPVMTIAYLILSAVVLFSFKENILPCISSIFKEAFTFKAVSGYGLFNAMRYGISRGVFSNEAGLGSSTLLHSEVRTKDGENQGMWAMLEVLTDTVLLCTVTALVILVSTDDLSLYGAELSVTAYGSIGDIGKKGISVLTAVFAFTSLTSCSFYGEKSFEYLFGKRHTRIYKIAYSILAFVGCVNNAKIIWTVADICNGLMALPNLFAINSLSNEVEYPIIKHPNMRKNRHQRG